MGVPAAHEACLAIQACTKLYNPDECFGYVMLPNVDQTSQVKCCVKMTFKSKLPAEQLWETSVKAFNLGISDILSMSKWVAVLVMTWNLQAGKRLVLAGSRVVVVRQVELR